MKKLIFVRHGRAEEESPYFTDFERSLTTKGKSVTEQMAKILRDKEKRPDLFITSPAFRACETAMIFARVYDLDPEEVLLRSMLYNKATFNSFVAMLEEIDNSIKSVILFGHNPSFTEIPDKLSKEGCDFVPKSGIICLSFRKDAWKGLAHERGKIEFFLKPEKSA